MFKDGKIFGKINAVDCIIIAVIAILLFGVLAVKTSLFRPVTKVVRGEKSIEFVVVTRAYDVTAQEELFKPGDKTFITIRNVPYTELEVVQVKKDSAKEMFFNYDRPEIPYLIKNVAYPNRYQYEITVKDKAQITNDGEAVIGGNKIKIGLPVDLEGANYRLSGSVSDVRILEDK